MNKTEKIIQMIFVANHDSPVIVHPGKKSFYFPTPLITTKFSAVLRFRLLAIAFVRRDQLDSKFSQLRVERVGIISFVTDQFLRLLRYQSVLDRCADESDFMRRSTRCVNGE